MPTDRRSLLTAGLAAGLVPALPTAARPQWREPDASFPLWPGPAAGLLDPSLAERVTERSTDPAARNRALEGIRTPRLDVFRARQPNGAAVMITPGGGYQRVVIDNEGHRLAAWLAERGITAFVLFYRLPAEGWQLGRNVPLADAQRAIRLIRSRATEFDIDPKRVASLGFSAGGHLCADLATRFARKVYDPIDVVDTQDTRPFVAAPIYPVVSMDPAIAHPGSRERLIGKTPSPEWETEHSADRQVTAQTPPTFVVHAEDDKVVPVENSIRLRAALKAAGVPVETHLFEAGGHGFGLTGAAGKPAGVWPELFLAWAKTKGLMG